jgi:hypothetical protein
MSTEKTDIVHTLGLTRFDRNLANNIVDFGSYGRDSFLIKDLVLFFAHDNQHKVCYENLFGKKELDPEVFAKLVNRKNYKALFKKHPDPAQLYEKRFANLPPETIEQMKLDSRGEDGEPLFDNWIDNALYRCWAEPMRFSKKGKTFDGANSSELMEFRFLKSLKKNYHPKTKKITYEFELHDTFTNDLARFFLKLDFKIYTAIEKPSYKDFYISMINLRDAWNQENHTSVRVETNFDNLCALAKTNCRLPEDRKKHINRAVKELNKLHGSEFVKITWAKNGNHDFKPILDFALTEKEQLEMHSEHKNRYRHFVIMNLKTKFRENFSHIKEEQEFNMTFRKWLREPDWLFEVKHSVVIKTHVQVFGKPPIDMKTKKEDIWSSGVLKMIKETLPEIALSPAVL